MTDLSSLNPDSRDLITSLCDADAQFLIVGAYAVLLRNKRASGRAKDLVDIEALEKIHRRKPC